jgi:hypothetical protein
MVYVMCNLHQDVNSVMIFLLIPSFILADTPAAESVKCSCYTKWTLCAVLVLYNPSIEQLKLVPLTCKPGTGRANGYPMITCVHSSKCRRHEHLCLSQYSYN